MKDYPNIVLDESLEIKMVANIKSYGPYYYGQVNDSNEAHGFGRYIHSNGSLMYEGYYENNDIKIGREVWERKVKDVNNKITTNNATCNNPCTNCGNTNTCINTRGNIMTRNNNNTNKCNNHNNT